MDIWAAGFWAVGFWAVDLWSGELPTPTTGTQSARMRHFRNWRHH